VLVKLGGSIGNLDSGIDDGEAGGDGFFRRIHILWIESLISISGHRANDAVGGLC
jgi:hypothetical protein